MEKRESSDMGGCPERDSRVYSPPLSLPPWADPKAWVVVVVVGTPPLSPLACMAHKVVPTRPACLTTNPRLCLEAWQALAGPPQLGLFSLSLEHARNDRRLMEQQPWTAWVVGWNFGGRTGGLTNLSYPRLGTSKPPSDGPAESLT